MTLEHEGTALEPEGTTLYHDGRCLEPEGKTLEHDGIALEPEGKTLEDVHTTSGCDGLTFDLIPLGQVKGDKSKSKNTTTNLMKILPISNLSLQHMLD